jgi:hypothetical protein
MICPADPLPIQVEGLPECISVEAAKAVAVLLLELVELAEQQAGDSGEGDDDD